MNNIILEIQFQEESFVAKFNKIKLSPQFIAKD